MANISFETFAISAIIIGCVVIQNIQKVKANETATRKLSTPIITAGLIVIIALIPVFVAVLLIVVVYRSTVHVILKLKHGRSYVGLVTGIDATHTIDEPSNSKTCLLVILETDRTKSPSELLEIAKDHFNSTLKCVQKLQSTYQNFMGYTYMVQATVEADECIKEMTPVNALEEEIDEDGLVTLLSNAYNSDFPRRNTIFWDFLISMQPIKRNQNNSDNKKYYPALFRIHHCVADGVAVFKFLVGVLGSAVTISNVSKSGIEEEKNINVLNTFKNLIGTLVEGLRVMLLVPSSTFVNLLLKGNDHNFLQSSLYGESLLLFSVEQDDTYFQKIKTIKRRISGTSFPEIVLTAISASLSKHYYVKFSDRPKYITVAIPVVPGSDQLQRMLPGSLRISNLKFSNNYAPILLNLPLCIKTSLTSRLELIKSQTKIISNSVDYQVTRIFMKALAFLPRPLMRLFLIKLNCTAAVSIMPGSCKMSFGRGKAVYADCGFWVPHLKNMGIGFSVFTYDGRLFIGLSVDKNVPLTMDEGRGIINDVFSCIDLLEKEVTSTE